MEKKKLTEDDRKLLEGGGFTEFLKAKKARDGRLNAIGEWFLKKKGHRAVYQERGHEVHTEMRYYLDTNILAFLVTEQEDEICADVKAELSDYANQFLASSVCVMELMHLLQTGKLPPRRRHPYCLGWTKRA